jgi:anti-sigma B factor antagonist
VSVDGRSASVDLLDIHVSDPSPDGEVVVRLDGEFDVSAEELFMRTVTLGIAQNGLSAVTVDLAGLTFVDSTGLHALLEVQRLAADRGARLVFTRVPLRIRRVMEISGVAPKLAFEDDGRSSESSI